MPKFDPNLTKTYIGVREHPVLGLLVKIGSSMDPDHRCRSLGAKRVGPLLPYSAERQLQDDLHDLRAFPEKWPQLKTQPTYHASGEWFKATEDAGRIIRRYIRNRNP